MSGRWDVLDSRLGRRLLLMFVVVAVVPFALAGTAAWFELDRGAERADAERMHLLAKSVGMEVAGRIELAAQTFAAELARIETAGQLPPEVVVEKIRSQLAGLSLFTGRVVVEPGSGQALASGGATGLGWRRSFGASDGPATLVALRRPRTSSQTIAVELRASSVFAAVEGFSGMAEIAVLLADGTPVTGGGDGVPEAVLASVKRQSQAPRSDRRLMTAEDGGRRWRWTLWRHPFGPSYPGAPTLLVIAYKPAPTLLATIGSLQVAFPLVMLAALLLAITLSISQIRRQLRPLDALMSASRRLAARDFDIAVRIDSGDEFQQLGAAFNDMTAALKREFATVEAMERVDRLLLESRSLETVLDALLPSVCNVMDCWSATVLLLDRDAPERVRAFDFVTGMSEPMPVRRVAVDVAALARQFEGVEPLLVTSGQSAEPNEFLRALIECGGERFELRALRRGADFAGVLCLGWDKDLRVASTATAPGHHAAGLADRLSVALTNLMHGESLYREAHFDALTGLPNRRLFNQRVSEALGSHASDAAALGAVVFVDLDHFKKINDTAGHGMGDQLLRVVAQRLSGCCSTGSTVARLGGDEFALLVPSCGSEEALVTLAERILGVLNQPFVLGRREHQISASVGIAVFPADGESLDELLKHADIAMYGAKESGRNRALFFEAGMNSRMQVRVEVESGLHRALRGNGFRLHYQPIVTAAENRLAGAEALIRWPDGAAAAAGPAQFIQVAEESGLIVEMGEWALNEVLAESARWRAQGLDFAYVSVNVSPRQLAEPRFLERVGNAFARSSIAPRQVLFEVTESVFAEVDVTKLVLRGLAGLGARIAIDDFGTGYSSLAYLRDLPIDAVKVDRSFVSGVPLDDSACKLVDTIVAMGHALGKTVIAEGVETADQFAYLQRLGCDSIQGYFIAKPMAPDAFTTWAQEWIRRRPVAAAQAASG